MRDGNQQAIWSPGAPGVARHDRPGEAIVEDRFQLMHGLCPLTRMQHLKSTSVVAEPSRLDGNACIA